MDYSKFDDIKYYEVLYGNKNNIKKKYNLEEGLLKKFSFNKSILYNDKGETVSWFNLKEIIYNYNLKLNGYYDNNNNFIYIENEINEEEFNQIFWGYQNIIVKININNNNTNNIKKVKIKKDINFNKSIILNKDKIDEYNENLYLDNNFIQKLKDYQLKGVKKLIKNITGIKNKNNFGCILGDSMGLGKTIQILMTLYILLNQNPFEKGKYLKKVLILCNSSLVETWKKEIDKW